MANKVIIGLLVFLVVLSGGLGAYSYTLTQQVEALSVQLGVFQQEQSARISAVSDELTALRTQAITRISILEDEIGGTLTRISTLEGKVSETLPRIDTLEDEVADVTTEISHSVMNADKIYQTASRATVRISDGNRTIGSGFMLDISGYVVTAYHVAGHMSDIYVVFPDGKVSKATVTGGCEFSDVAVLNLEDEVDAELTVWADSSTVRVGEPVIAVGSPFDLMQTITSGIVSQVNRFVAIDDGSETRWVSNLIQFDAAVNFGNSGGPLLNSKGEVIGMVVGRINPDRGDGIYYAVSSNKVKRVATSIIEKGSFDQPWLGIAITNLTPRVVQTRGLESTYGVLVQSVFTGSPSEQAGIQADDVIVAVDGVVIKDAGHLTSYLAENRSPSEQVLVGIIRNSAELELPIEIGKRLS
ncbi:trypsin-like peptidase domain-containing protein [Chloroflexota bacterium]